MSAATVRERPASARIPNGGVAAAVATSTPSPATAAFGTAQDLATLTGSSSHVAAEIASLSRRFGRVDVIENQTLTVPGSVQSFDLRAQDPHGPFGQPMLSLVSGRYPAGPGQVAVTSGVASDFGLTAGRTWTVDGTTRPVTGIVRISRGISQGDKAIIINPVDSSAAALPAELASRSNIPVISAGRGVTGATVAQFLSPS